MSRLEFRDLLLAHCRAPGVWRIAEHLGFGALPSTWGMPVSTFSKTKRSYILAWGKLSSMRTRMFGILLEAFRGHVMAARPLPFNDRLTITILPMSSAVA
jgi:hypothetical protein